VARGPLNPQTGLVEEYITTQPGDQLLLCTDGLYHRQPDASILRNLLTQAQTPQAAVNALIATAVENGESDDITALLCTIPLT
jgi:protein phosphatase